MSNGRSPLEDVVTPAGSAEGVALWHDIADFIGNEGGDGDKEAFNRLALRVFRFQFKGCPLYRKWCGLLGWSGG